METKTLYQLRRTSSLPTGKVAHSNIENFNGLEIKYIGSCTLTTATRASIPI